MATASTVPAWTAAARPPLETARLVIAPLAEADAPALAAVTDAPDILARLHFLPAPFDVAAARALIASDPGFNGIRRRRDGVLVGMIGTHFGADGVEIGYWIGAGHRRQGYAREAVRAVIAVLGDQPAFAECARDNAASWRLLESCGFRPTGRAGRRPGRDLLSRRAPKACG